MSNDFSLGTVETALTPLARFEEYLQSRGKRITQQRRVLVEEVFKHHDHFDAEDLIQSLGRVVGPRRVSRPTVYRTLAELVDAGLLRDMVLDGRIGIRARLRLSAARSSLLPEVPQADRVPQRRGGRHSRRRGSRTSVSRDRPSADHQRRVCRVPQPPPSHAQARSGVNPPGVAIV